MLVAVFLVDSCHVKAGGWELKTGVKNWVGVGKK